MTHDRPDGSASGSAASAAADAPPSREQQIRSILSTIRDRLEFETASLFVPAGEAWHLSARVGPKRPWHVVLDPDLIESLATGGVYANARSMPGVGLRLSGLGCGSVGIHPVPGGGVLVLDSAFPRTDGQPTAPEPATLALLGESLGSTDRQKREESPDDLDVVTKIADAMRRTLDVPGYTVSRLLQAIAESVGADRVVLLAEEHDRVTRVYTSGDDQVSTEATSPIEAILRILPPLDPIPDEHAQRLAAALGLHAEFHRIAFCREDGGRELLLATFALQPDISPEAFAIIARIAGGTRVALDIRRDAIEQHLLPERSKWAHDIHDGLTQVVTAAVIQLENLRHLIPDDPQAAASALEESQEQIRGTLAELRAVMADLSEEGSVHRRRPLSEQLTDIVQRWRLPARIHVDGDVNHVPRQVLAVTLIVVREALTNAAKHSSAKNVSVRVSAQPDAVTLAVHDNGRGFDPRALDRGAGRLHFGIRMMRQRVADLGGTIQISSTPGRGTKVIAHLPTQAQRPGSDDD